MKLSVFNAAVFLVVIVCVHCSSHRDRSGDGFSVLKEGACMKLNKYLVRENQSLEACKRKCAKDTCCKSVSYLASNRSCRFSKLGSNSPFYLDQCWSYGYAYTEKLEDISLYHSWSKVKNACIRENEYKVLEDHSLESCKAICKEDRDTGVKSCKSINYHTSTRTCHFSTCSHQGARYTEPCHLPGFEWTEIQYDCRTYSGVLIGGQYLTFSTEKVSWLLANERCKSQNAKLVELNNPQAFHTYVASKYRGERFWLGGSDRDNEGSWTWINGQSFGSFPWGPGQPNDDSGNEDCLEWGFKDNYNDNPCSRAQRFVCDHGTCPDGFVGVGSQCFMYVKEEKTWDDARSYCQGWSADLPQPRDFEAFQTFTKGDTSSRYYSWLGARKEGGIFKWFNGTDAPVNGNHNIGDCVLYDGSHAGWASTDNFIEAPAVLGWYCNRDTFWFVCEAS